MSNSDFRHVADVLMEDYVLPHGLTKGKVADDMNIQRPKLARLLSKIQMPNFEFLVAIANFTGTNPHYWIDQHARWLHANIDVIMEAQQDRRCIFYNEYKSCGEVPFTEHERSFFGYNKNVPDKEMTSAVKRRFEMDEMSPPPPKITDPFSLIDKRK